MTKYRTLQGFSPRFYKLGVRFQPGDDLNVRRFNQIAAAGGAYDSTPGRDPSTARRQLQTKALGANDLLFEDLCGWLD